MRHFWRHLTGSIASLDFGFASFRFWQDEVRPDGHPLIIDPSSRLVVDLNSKTPPGPERRLPEAVTGRAFREQLAFADLPEPWHEAAEPHRALDFRVESSSGVIVIQEREIHVGCPRGNQLAALTLTPASAAAAVPVDAIAAPTAKAQRALRLIAVAVGARHHCRLITGNRCLLKRRFGKLYIGKRFLGQFWRGGERPFLDADKNGLAFRDFPNGRRAYTCPNWTGICLARKATEVDATFGYIDAKVMGDLHFASVELLQNETVISDPLLQRLLQHGNPFPKDTFLVRMGVA